MIEILPLVAIVAPFLLWPIEILIGYGILIEEFAKFGFCYVVYKQEDKSLKTKIKLLVISVSMFGFSEAAFYLFNIYISGSIFDFGKRLIITVPMHVVTGIVMFGGLNKSRLFGVIGLIIAIWIHYIFNSIVS